MKNNYQKIIDFLGKDRVKLNEPLANHTTFKIGGPADLFYEAKNEEELIKAVSVARKIGISFFILGNGSKLLIGDKGFQGLVIKNKNKKIEITDERTTPKVFAGSGLYTEDLIRKLLDKSIGGLEFMVGIPATVGGAVRGNAGAWQQAIGDKVSRVKVLTSTGEVKWLDRTECEFNYRQSRFKRTDEVILEVEFILEKKDKKEIEKKIVENLEKRKKQPREPSAGCIFVNPKPNFAGELIEKCGLKGMTIGGAQISPKHANFIVNLGGAKARDVLQLIKREKTEVKKKFDIELTEEVVMVGKFD